MALRNQDLTPVNDEPTADDDTYINSADGVINPFLQPQTASLNPTTTAPTVYGVDPDAISAGNFSNPLPRPPSVALYHGPAIPGKFYSGPLTTSHFDNMARLPVDNLCGVLHTNVRGVRLNNFGNLNNGQFCAHQIGYAGPEAGYNGREAAFTKPEYGVLAADKLLDVYASHGRVTARQIIQSWAPPNENNTSDYYTQVARRLGIDVDQPIPKDKRGELLSEIFHVENGVDPFGPARINFIIAHRSELEAGKSLQDIEKESAVTTASATPTVAHGPSYKPLATTVEAPAKTAENKAPQPPKVIAAATLSS